MNTHPYLRAFLAGVFVPTLILPLLLTFFVVTRLVLHWPIPIERGLVFPMALVPVLWGLWSMLWLWSHTQTHLPIGAHGAILPFLLLPGGAAVAKCFGIIAFGASAVASSETPRTRPPPRFKAKFMRARSADELTQVSAFIE